MAILEARTQVYVQCSCGWVLNPRWWATWTMREAELEAREHTCLNGRWDARIWPQLQLKLAAATVA